MVRALSKALRSLRWTYVMLLIRFPFRWPTSQSWLSNDFSTMPTPLTPPPRGSRSAELLTTLDTAIMLSTSAPRDVHVKPWIDIVWVYPLAGIVPEGAKAPVEALYSDIQRVGESLYDSFCRAGFPRVRNVPYAAFRLNGKYGSLSHLCRLEEEMINTACDIYMYLYHKRRSKDRVYIVAVESGAFMVARLLEFIQIYGLDVHVGMEDFLPLWCAHIAGYRPKHPPDPVQFNLQIESVILIRPSLPKPRCIASLVWKIFRPFFYSPSVFNPSELPSKEIFWVDGARDADASSLFVDMVLGNGSNGVIRIDNVSVPSLVQVAS
ncbi:LOW QUALITY PROTEIN: hypothetical protein CVT26_002393 [Gymnopilus dilepis]|uniref:Uncharacterized protein n=1 Tax=Gymnopilus dilepis TaxID=231916 RepID=A0A409YN77_9AGAR|nr:LOW QUALITY PROTEIN: hypothetical protein CVT26_002393 [Gymnopilus dilepis]